MTGLPPSNFSQPSDRSDERYRGLPSPVTRGVRGYLQTAYTRDLIYSSLYNILSTRKGERVNLPEFGTRLHTLLFEPLDAITRKLAENIVTEDIQRWENRIELLDVKVGQNDDLNEMTVSVRYVIIGTGQSDQALLTITE